MATGTRLRSGTVYGTLSDALLTNSSGAVTMNSLGLGSAFCPAVAAPQYMAVILDPQQQVGAPEIVWVTAHTGSANTATVVRAQESSTLRAHNSGEFWVAGPTPEDYFPWNWTSYTPTWTGTGSNPSIGNGTLTGSYLLFGTTCFLSIYMAIGSTTTGGSGAWLFALPPGVAAPTTINQNLTCGVSTSGGASAWAGYGVIGGAGGFQGSGTTVAPYASTSGASSSLGPIQPGLPGAFTVGSTISISGSFQTT